MQSEIVQEWLRKADEDYGFASASIEHNEYYAQICFHFQQAAEKYLKAFIIANKIEFRSIHNLLELFKLCREKNVEVKEVEQDCRYLNPFYIDTRYPVHWPTHYDKDVAVKARESTTKIRDCVKALLE